VAFGNIVEGLYLSNDMEYAGNFLGLLNPFSILFGLVSLALLASHGALYLVLKTEGKLQERMKSRAVLGAKVIPLALTVAMASAYFFTSLTQSAVAGRPLLALTGLLAVLSGAAIGPVLRKNPSKAFFLSCTALVLTLVFFFGGLYPNLVYSPLTPGNSMTILNASSSPETLKVMLVIALLTFPFVVGYTIWVHRIFKGPSRPDDHGY
jgi:cytochrome d ubiquinol oxidase subunit II